MSLNDPTQITLEKSGVEVRLSKKIRLVSGFSSEASAPIPTDIVGEGNELQLYRNGEPLKGQTPQLVKTIGNESIFGEGNINIPSKVSELLNDQEFVTRSVNDLLNYYTKEEIDDKIIDKGGVRLEIVDDLPEKGEINVLYLYLESENVYSEYFWYRDKWQLVGTNAVTVVSIATSEKVGGILSSDERKSEDGTRLYVNVDRMSGVSSVAMPRVNEMPNAKEDILSALNSANGIILNGGAASSTFENTGEEGQNLSINGGMSETTFGK